MRSGSGCCRVLPPPARCANVGPDDRLARSDDMDGPFHSGREGSPQQGDGVGHGSTATRGGAVRPPRRSPRCSSSDVDMSDPTSPMVLALLGGVDACMTTGPPTFI